MGGDIPIEVFARYINVRKYTPKNIIDLLFLKLGRAFTIWLNIKVVIVSGSWQIALAKEVETFDFFQAFLRRLVDEVEQCLPIYE